MEDQYKEYTWLRIRDDWKEEDYINSEYKCYEVSSNITHSGTYRCNTCLTKWKEKSFIYEQKRVFAVCDTLHEPYLSNPKNRSLVIKYIDNKYHKYIFSKE